MSPWRQAVPLQIWLYEQQSSDRLDGEMFGAHEAEYQDFGHNLK
jgi:hypothetical protein